jgi:hypothetical protein
MCKKESTRRSMIPHGRAVSIHSKIANQGEHVEDDLRLS